MSGLRLGVNVDHVATLRQARYATMPESKNAEPDLIIAARMCERAGAQEILDVALRIVPDEVCLVPEKREEVTTEGGLDVIANRKTLEPTIKRLHTSGIRISLFINPTLEQVDAAAALGVEMVELHTGSLANAFTEKIQKEELEQLRAAARAAAESNLQVNAGHGINYKNIELIHQVPCLTELNIGHSIVSRAVWVGLETAIKEMLAAMKNYPG